MSLKFIISHPAFWVIIFISISILFKLMNKKYLAVFSILLASMFVGTMTPLGSAYLLRGIVYLNPVELKICKGANIRSLILLPGGVYSKNGSIKLNSWSKRRADHAIKIIIKNSIKELIIPGGDQYEGRMLKKYIDFNNVPSILVGPGSRTTYENFIELEPYLNKQDVYLLTTSFWHYARAARVAKKLGYRVCPAPTKVIDPVGILYGKDIHWQGKAALHEIIALFYYKFANRI